MGFDGFTVQPSELVKIVYLFVLSYLLSRRRIVTGMIFIGLMLGFLVLQRDLGTAAIYGGAGLVLLYAATSSLLLIGGILAAQAIMPTTGLFIIVAFWCINKCSKKPLVSMAVGPLGAILVGLIANVLFLLSLYTPAA